MVTYCIYIYIYIYIYVYENLATFLRYFKGRAKIEVYEKRKLWRIFGKRRGEATAALGAAQWRVP
jgi:hypothetical protein